MNASMTNARIESMSRKELLTRIFGAYDIKPSCRSYTKAELVARAKRVRNAMLNEKHNRV